MTASTTQSPATIMTEDTLLMKPCEEDSSTCLTDASSSLFEEQSAATTTTAVTATSSSQDKLAERVTRVGFSSVQIRLYNRILGDHPEVKSAPALAIGWEYHQDDTVDVDAYEAQKAANNNNDNNNKNLDKNGELRRLTNGNRRDALRPFGVTPEQIIDAQIELCKIQKQRQQTLNQTKAFAKTEELLQSAKRKFKRTFATSNNSKEQQQPENNSNNNHKPMPVLAVSAY